MLKRLIFLIIMRTHLMSPMNFISLKMSMLRWNASVYSFKSTKSTNFSILLFNSLDLIKISSFFRGMVNLYAIRELFMKLALYFFNNINLYKM